jgi:DNA-binding CsgD family transcriptional regulator
MGQGWGPSRRLSFAERLELQRRVRDGETFQAAAAAMGCSSKSVQRLMARTGGVKPRTRPVSRLRLSLAEREEISRGVLAGESGRLIAVRLGRSPSTVSREIGRNGGRGGYRAWHAQERAHRRARRPKIAKLAGSRGCGRWSSSCRLGAGHRSRSRRDWSSTPPMMRSCGCRTRPSTSPCSCRPAARCARSSPRVCGRGGRSDAGCGARPRAGGCWIWC